jgi:hypothetical protein
LPEFGFVWNFSDSFFHLFAPSHERKTGTFAMSEVPIPPDIEPDILPPENLSVWEFTSFELPRPSRTAAKAASVADYFVTGTPKVVDTNYIRALIPPKDDLVENCTNT